MKNSAINHEDDSGNMSEYIALERSNLADQSFDLFALENVYGSRNSRGPSQFLKRKTNKNTSSSGGITNNRFGSIVSENNVEEEFLL